MKPYLSVIVCVYNERENIRPLVDKIRKDLDGIDYELIYVDDGSTDGTVGELKEVMFDRLRIVELRKNYGQSAALAAGIDEARGTYLATLDGDLQNDPVDIPMMLAMAEKEEWDLVAGIRANRQDGMILRKIPSKIANAIIRQSTGIHIKDYGCTLKVFKSDVAKDMGLYGELHRFIPVLASLEGARITQVDVHHHPRIHGVSKYGIGRTFRVISDLLLMVFFRRYLQKPMHLFGTSGVIAFGVGALINLYLLGLKLMGQDIWGKPLLILGVLLVIGGIQFITIGIIVEIMMRTYYESQNKTVYKVRRIIQSGSDRSHG
ncbi:MAG: glycosyltransferase family 2 protein [Saprospiraceae bacterium]|nr:glycosyltransferase family 2 protein [Saprospiraceae bacterium]